ncbi:hypothetical protein ABVF67_004517 [Vibrio parahaemolyticus]|uniref:Sbal_3080 family lipoprotein n=1 Tax=Vibrio parahaemolyticus TaxID=670 RepID=UPI000676F6AC|nr:Sbal_3080 family lipoprotein [Vibrio parahaemolyticus]MBM4973444.1 hypothetical protein [Vibrio parahaemolyticus]MDF4340738.1 Sbal_3080 family lipoprotein [Vibrio parahaemolyticus]HDZ3738700.1 hypothetical protein [Vibrio vulnificus]HEB2779495.1 hypothetical protein [Vibrio vulnificus]
MKNKIVTLVAPLVLISGCTSINVVGLDSANMSRQLCFENNAKVYAAFMPEIETMVENQGYRVLMYPQYQTAPEQCELVVKYTAKRSWDVTPYLAFAEFKVYDLKGNRLAYGKYEHKGGLALNKWASIEEKLSPVISELFPYIN